MAVPYYGDFPEDHTGVKIPFNTFSSDDPSKSCTITELADSDIKVYKDGGDTEIATDGASVLINFDSHTGAHLITIDTSVHSDYSTGSEYAVLIDGTVIDAATDMDMWIGTFSIERAGGVLALLKGGTTKVDVETIKTKAVTCGAAVTVRADVGAAAAPGAANGMFIGGTNAATTVASLSCTGQLDAGTVIVDATMDVVGELSANSILVDGQVDIKDGIVVTCTTDSKSAIKATGGATAGDGMELIGTGTGIDLNADITGNITGDISGDVGTCSAATVSAIGNDVITPASVDEDADFVIQALSITNALDAGSVLVDGTTTLTGNVSCGAGFDVVGALSANTLLIDSTTTLTGAVSCGSTFDVVGELSANSVLVDVGTVLTGAVTTGAITADALSVTNQLDAGNVVVDAGMDVVGALSANSLLIDTTTTLTGNVEMSGTFEVAGATALTGAVTAPAGITADITGNISGSVGTCAAATVSAIGANVIDAASLKADACTKIIDDFETQSQADPTGFHVNLKEINDTAVAGDGAGTPWGP